MPPPRARFVAPLRRPVEPLVHAPEPVQSARISGIGVIDDAILEHKRAHAGSLPGVGADVGAGHRSVIRRARGCRWLQPRLMLVVVFEAALALLLLRKRDVEVEVEFRAEG